MFNTCQQRTRPRHGHFALPAAMCALPAPSRSQNSLLCWLTPYTPQEFEDNFGTRWVEQVTSINLPPTAKNPDKTKIIVFKKGTPQVLKVIIPCGGRLLLFQPKVKYLNEKKPKKMTQKT